jgi:hypothetical protein
MIGMMWRLMIAWMWCVRLCVSCSRMVWWDIG